MRRSALKAVLGALALLSMLLHPPGHARADGLRLPRDFVDAPAAVLEGTVPPIPASHVRETVGRVEVSYPPAIRDNVRGAIARIGGNVDSIARQLGLSDVPRLRVRFVENVDAMRTLAPGAAPPPAYAVGVAYPSIGLTLVSIVAPHSNEAADVPRVLRHELSHLLLGAATRGGSVPRWFSEGLAVQHAAEHSFTRFRTLAMAAFWGNLAPLREFDRAFAEDSGRVELAYAQASDFVDHLMRVENGERFRVMLAHMRAGQAFERAVRESYGLTIEAIDEQWRHETRARFLAAPLWAGTGLLWIVGAMLLVIGVVRRRRQSRATIARWEAESQALERYEITVTTPGLTASRGQDDSSERLLN